MYLIPWSLIILAVFTQKMSCKAHLKGRSKGTGKGEHHFSQGWCAQFVLVDETACLQWDSPKGLGWATDIWLIFAIYICPSLNIYICIYVCVCVYTREESKYCPSLRVIPHLHWKCPIQLQHRINKLEIQFSVCSMCKWHASLFKSFQYSSRVTCKTIILHFAVWELFLYNC